MKRIFLLFMILFIISLPPLLAQEVEAQTVYVEILDASETNVTNQESTIEEAFSLIEAVQLYLKAAKEVFVATLNDGISLSDLVLIIFAIILPGLTLLSRVLIFILNTAKIFTYESVDEKIDKIISRIDYITSILKKIKEARKT